jgi:hypothetical protein
MAFDEVTIPEPLTMRVFLNGRVQSGQPTQALLKIAQMENNKGLAFYDDEQDIWIAYEYPHAPEKAQSIGADVVVVNLWLTKSFQSCDLN